jgi:hypothetical protein
MHLAVRLQIARIHQLIPFEKNAIMTAACRHIPLASQITARAGCFLRGKKVSLRKGMKMYVS